MFLAVPPLLTEALLLASLGGALGILVAKWSGQLLPGSAGQATAIDKNLQQERVFAQAYAMFGGLALLLASVGLFGLMS